MSIANLSRNQLITEYFLIFVALPILLATPIHWAFKLAGVAMGLSYLLRLLHQHKWLKKAPLLRLTDRDHWARINKLFLLFVLLSTPLVYFLFPDLFLSVVLQKPWLWLFILFVYAIFSVYPQELLYRAFYVKRYGHLFSGWSYWSIILLNALVFSLAHLFLFNGLVMALTFAGGLLFMHTYLSTKSIMTTSIEHALYGLWIFTLGLGEMLAFPA